MSGQPIDKDEEIETLRKQVEFVGGILNDIACVLDDEFGVPRVGCGIAKRVRLLGCNGFIQRAFKRLIGHWGWLHVCSTQGCPWSRV